MPRNAAAAVPSAVTSMISHLRRRSMPTTSEQVDRLVLAENGLLGGDVAGLGVMVSVSASGPTCQHCDLSCPRRRQDDGVSLTNDERAAPSSSPVTVICHDYGSAGKALSHRSILRRRARTSCRRQGTERCSYATSARGIARFGEQGAAGCGEPQPTRGRRPAPPRRRGCVPAAALTHDPRRRSQRRVARMAGGAQVGPAEHRIGQRQRHLVARRVGDLGGQHRRCPAASRASRAGSAARASTARHAPCRGCAPERAHSRHAIHLPAHAWHSSRDQRLEIVEAAAVDRERLDREGATRRSSLRLHQVDGLDRLDRAGRVAHADQGQQAVEAALGARGRRGVSGARTSDRRHPGRSRRTGPARRCPAPRRRASGRGRDRRR